jgi:DNA polymerase-3 subunit delta
LKLTGKKIEAFFAQPDPSMRAILIYGPDQGLVKERFDLLTQKIVPDLKDPFRISEIYGSKLKDDPGHLHEEALAMSLTGGQRVVRVREATDYSTDSIRSFLETHPPSTKEETLILFEAGELSPRSSLRKFFEDNDHTVSIPCYNDDGYGLENTIGQMIREQGYTASNDIIHFLAENLGSDRLITRSEITKLLLYMGDNKIIKLDDVEQCIGDSSVLALDEFALTIADGNMKDSQNIFLRLLADGVAVIAILRSLQRHFKRLHFVRSQIEQNNKTIETALSTLKPAPHFRAIDRVKTQVSRLSLIYLSQSLEAILNAENDCKTSGMPDKEICGRLSLHLAKKASLFSSRK